MIRLRQFTRFLNIEPGEERLIGLLILLYFVLTLAFTLVESMAFGLFIAEYGAKTLPYSYITISVLASLTAILYIKLGERVQFSTLLEINLAFLLATCFLAWLGLNSPFTHIVSFLLPTLFQIVINLGNLIVWPLAGRLFDFRQGKRLFPLLGAGTWLANLIGGLLIAPLVAWMGATNLLLLAVANVGIAYLVFRQINKIYLYGAATSSPSRRATNTNKQAPGLFKNRYILLIFAYITIWWIAFFFLDNIFSDRAAARFPDVAQLTIFMGQLLSVMGIVGLISSTFLTARIIGRFGIRVGLIGMPMLVTFIVGGLVLSGRFGATLLIVFGLSAFAKLITSAFGFSLSQSANAIVYQSLSDRIRRRVQATAEGVVQPIAIGLAGLSLLALTAGLKFNYLGLSYTFLGLAFVWLIIIFLLSGGYVNALTQAISKRRLGASPTVFADPASIAILQGYLHDPHPEAAIYALDRLEELDTQAAARALPELIQHPAPEVRREAMKWIESLAVAPALDSLHSQLAVEENPDVREAGLRALGAIGGAQASAQLTDALTDNDPHALRGALIGLLKYGDSSEPLTAQQTLNSLLASPMAANRILAAQVLGSIEQPQFNPARQALLGDDDPQVRCEMLQSLGKIRQPELYPLIIKACDMPETSRSAATALIAAGTEGLSEIESAFDQTGAPRIRLLTLAKVLGHIGGKRAQAFLRARMDSPDSELRSQILNALGECDYRVKDLSEISTSLEKEVKSLAWVCAAQVDLGDGDQTTLLSAALRQFAAQVAERILLLLSFIFDKSSILSAREAFLTGSPSQLAYALEIIDAQLPAEWKPRIMPVLEDLSPHDRLEQLAAIYPQRQQKSDDRLYAMIVGLDDQQFTRWVRVCAMYSAARLSSQTCKEAISEASSEADTLVRDTACWALTQLAPERPKGYKAMLTTIEKVIILKMVDIFSKTPDDVLADVANLLEEVEISEEETIFKQGDLGDSMYVIVDGKVRVQDGEHLLNYLGDRDVFGEMALLDPEPRMASVTAVEPTRLFRLDQTPFYQLIAERPEVATGIIRVLTRHLRNRASDIASLNDRYHELESRSQIK